MEANTVDNIPFPVARMEYDPADNGRAMGELLLGILEGRMTKPARLTIGFNWEETESPVRANAAICASPTGEAVGCLV